MTLSSSWDPRAWVNTNPWYQKLFKKKQAYRRLFLAPNGELTPDARIVLNDIARFCSAHQPATRKGGDKVDALATMQVVGRNEVWQRINAQLYLDIRQTINPEE